MSVRVGLPSDLDALLALYDDAVARLAARGLAGQWGSTPWSQSDVERAKVSGWLEAGEVRVLEQEDVVVAAVALGEPPDHAPSPEGCLWVRGLVSSRRGLGAVLVGAALDEARLRGLSALGLDCWDGGDGALVSYYERLGLTAGGRFVQGSWTGRYLRLAL